MCRRNGLPSSRSHWAFDRGCPTDLDPAQGGTIIQGQTEIETTPGIENGIEDAIETETTPEIENGTGDESETGIFRASRTESETETETAILRANLTESVTEIVAENVN